MKYFTIFALFLAIFVVYAQAQRCPGLPRTPTCVGNRDTGRGGRGCAPRIMWHYDVVTRQCRELRYLGCRGNNNRHCTRASCERSCRR